MSKTSALPYLRPPVGSGGDGAARADIVLKLPRSDVNICFESNYALVMLEWEVASFLGLSLVVTVYGTSQL